jgi:hypothetical protein
VLPRQQQGKDIDQEDLDDLELLHEKRWEDALDRKELKGLRQRKALSEDLDEDYLYKLELFERHVNGDQLDDTVMSCSKLNFLNGNGTERIWTKTSVKTTSICPSVNKDSRFNAAILSLKILFCPLTNYEDYHNSSSSK